MKVLTFLGEDFDNLCFKLADMVINMNFTPDIVIGVLTGGGCIGQRSMIEFRKKNIQHNIHYTEVKIQRPSTIKKKDHNLKTWLVKLPVCLLNTLRVLEVYYYEIKVRFVKPNRQGVIALDKTTDDLLKVGGKKVLIIDDCIDTGFTLKIIKDYLMLNYPGNDFRVAVATVSHHFPVIHADYQLYDRTLIRFPWANDVKENE